MRKIAFLLTDVAAMAILLYTYFYDQMRWYYLYDYTVWLGLVIGYLLLSVVYFVKGMRKKHVV